MCKVAGPRCSQYSKDTLDILSRRNTKVSNALADYEEKYTDTLAKEEDLSKSDTIRHHKHQRLLLEAEEVQKKFEQAEFDYYSCPVGQKELEERIAEAVAAEDEVEADRLKIVLEGAQNYRKVQQRTGRELREIEAELGPEAAHEEALRRSEELDSLQQETQTKLLEAQTERLRLEQEINSNDEEINELEERLDKAEDAIEEMTDEQRQAEYEAAQALQKAKEKKILMLSLLGAAAASVLLFQVTQWVITGRKSQLLQYARSSASRKAVSFAQRTASDFFKKKDD